MLESEVRGRNLIAGVMFTMIGIMLMIFGVMLFAGLASGRLTPGKYGWWGAAIVPAIGAVFLMGGISTIKGYSWFVLVLLLLRR